MKILVVTTSFPLSPGDSLSPFLWEYCRGLKNLGWEVTVIVPHHKGIKTSETWEGIKINRFKYLPESMETLAYSGGLLPGVKKNPLIALLLPLFIGSMYKKTLEEIRRGHFDIVNIHWLFPAAFWARRLSRKTGSVIVFTGHGTDIQISRKFPFNILARSALKIPAGLTVNSEYMKSLLDQFSIPSNTAVIPMGVDTAKFRPGVKRPSESKKVLYIGRLIKQKGVDILLEAFNSLKELYPDTQLEIIGYGPEKNALQEMVNRLNLDQKVVFSPAVPHEELPEKYREARLFALPSLIGEGFGMTAAEAAACGVPTVTFGLGGTGELVLDGSTGMITEPNAESLADGLMRLFADNDLVDRLGNKAQKRVEENFSWEVITEKFDSYFKSILNSQK